MTKLTVCLTVGSVLSLQATAQEHKPGTSDTLKNNPIAEVVVTGQYEPQSIKNSVYRVRAITREQIQARASTSVENILNTQLGIRLSNDMALGESDIELIGMSGQNVKVLIDGVPMIDRGASKQSLNQIDVNNIERIEIVEGPMSVSYGTDALAGVINIITRKADNEDHFTASLRIQEETAGNEYRPFSSEGVHNGNLSLEWQRQGWNVRASGSRNNFGGWQGTGEGRALQWKPKDQYLSSGTLGYNTGKTNIWYRLDYVNEDIYSSGVLNVNAGRATDQHFLTSRFTHLLNNDWSISDVATLSSSVSFQNYQRNTRTLIEDFRNGTSSLSTGAGEQDTAMFSSFVWRSTLFYKLSERLSIQPGLEVLSNKGSGQRIDGNPRITDYAAFVSAEWKPNSWLNLRPGIRILHNSVYDAPPAIPSLNAKFKLSETIDIRSAYARGFRSPALRELYFTFFDSNHAIRGNQNLQAEYSDSFNTFLSWHQDNWGSWVVNSTIGGYYNMFNNLITTGFDPQDPSLTTYINILKYRTAGASLENMVSRGNLTATVGFTYIGRYNELTESETDVPAMAWSPEANANILYNIPSWKAGINLFYKFNGSRPVFQTAADPSGAIFVNRAVFGAYHTADISLNKTITNYLTLHTGVRNLFNTTDVDNTSLAGTGAHSGTGGSTPLGYGRSFFVGLNMTWKK